ncbi:MAG: hypothetical protein KDD35_03630 [Bdellovibrionales bacterium]|nr:hypothetical protein [Bdellovibrionales bacterium]
MLLSLVFILIGCCQYSQAEEIRPFLTQWNEEEAQSLDTTKLWDAEYPSDRLTYSFPLLWAEEWSQMTSGYRMSLGSLSSKRFYNIQQIHHSSHFTEKRVISNSISNLVD